jgi:hypothetical protein
LNIPINDIEQRIVKSLLEKKTDVETISYINSPIDNVKQTDVQKKLNILKYWEVVGKRIKKEKAPLFKNHRSMKMPDPKKGIKFNPPPPRPVQEKIITGNSYTTKYVDNFFWIKDYYKGSKVFTLHKGIKFTKKEYVKYIWDRKDKYITAKWNSITIEDNWETHALRIQENIANKREFPFSLMD